MRKHKILATHKLKLRERLEFRFSIWGNFSLGLFGAGTRTDGVKREIERKRETCDVERRKKARTEV